MNSITDVPEPVDVLLVSPGTTAGWRRVDAEQAELLRELGLTVASASTEFRIARHLRRGVLLTDLAEAAAMRRALEKALKDHDPRAIVFSSPQAAMLQPAKRLRGATAVRFDEPAATNRSGPGTGLLHRLERRALGRVRLLLPMGIEPGAEARAIGVATPMIALPVAIATDQGPWRDREPVALAYAGNPEKKGLALLLDAWSRAAAPGWRLVVTGIDRAAARRHLARHRVAEPGAVEWTGMVSLERYAELLRSAAVFVSASRHEDYGLAQLEALGAGLELVTLAASGPYPALEVVRALDGRLVAAQPSAEALAVALEHALAMGADERARHAEAARALLKPHSRDELRRRLVEQVLPVLLPSS